VTPVDVSSAGDNAQAAIVEISGNGQTLNEAVVTLNTGPASDFLVADSSSSINPADVQNLAQTGANRLNSGLGG
jgi:ABC-type hemin transport system substrate-binding protein